MSFTPRYLVCLDFEATCDEPNNPDPQEIIEFPMVVIDTKSSDVFTFHEYVRPVHHPTLSEFCKELTKIPQEKIDAADTFDKVFMRVISFLHGFAGSTDGVLFIIDGNWDLQHMLPNQVKISTNPQIQHLYKIMSIDDEDDTDPAPLGSWVNIKKVYTSFMGMSISSPKIREMMQGLGLEFKGTLHSGIDDTRNIVSIVKALLKEGWIPESNRTLKTADPPVEHLVAAVDVNPIEKDGISMRPIHDAMDVGEQPIYHPNGPAFSVTTEEMGEEVAE
jgi:ERI1 exoribonuclease 3